MKKIISASLLTAEIAAFSMLILLYYVNTNTPYLPFIPIIGVIVGYCLFKLFARKLRLKREGALFPFAVAYAIFIGILIAAVIIVIIEIL